MRRLACGCVALLAWQAAALAACTVSQRAVVPMAVVQHRLLVPVMVNDVRGEFVLDTGAERSMVTPDAVRRLGLALDEWVGTRMRGIGGIVEHRNANPRSLTLGGVALRRRTVTHDTSLTVGAIPSAEIAGQRIDGLLGRDFLSPFDLLLDPAAATLTLYDVHGCAGPFLPWKHPYVAIQAKQPMDTAMVLPVTLDGVALQALLDTGATASVLTARGMVRLGLTSAHMARDAQSQARGVGPQPARMWQHRFASLLVGADRTANPLLWVAAIRVVPFVDMLLGEDWLAGRRVWISFATSQVFVAAR